MSAEDDKAIKNKEQSAEVLEFTGERFTPENLREIWYEHYHRYALASQLVTGLHVLDAACGEGYGSELLAGTAASVTGVDISADAINHASSRYGQRENLEFIQADCSQLDFEDNKFDAIISFETLEHLQEQESMLAGFRRILKPGGWLLISSPDKAEYSDAEDYSNPWHVKELYREELLELLGKDFSTVRLLGQKLAFHSIIWDLQATGAYQNQVLSEGQLATTDKLESPPLYFLAVCAASEEDLPVMPALNLFSDQQASVYQHYNHEIRKNMAAGELIAQRDKKIADLELQLQQQKPEATGFLGKWLSRFFKRN